MKVEFSANRDTFTVAELLGEANSLKFLAELQGYKVEFITDKDSNKKQGEKKND
jgi:hypothetical protein